MLLQNCHFSSKEVIENGNSFKPVARTTTNADGTSTKQIPGAVTTKEKIQKNNDVKARSILMMALPNEHLLTFNQHKDAKTLFAAIEARFGGNNATKKTQKTLLKQLYEKFTTPSTYSLDSIFNRIQKIVSQLAILGENIPQEDLNLKFLRSLHAKWNTHVVVWRNKPDLETMSFDDLYNNFKIVEQEVKRSSSSNSNSNSQNLAFISSTSSTNDVNIASVHVSTAGSSVSTGSTQDSTANLSDATVYAFLANQPNGSQLVHEDLEQIHEVNLEEMDLKWQLALLSMRARRYYQRTGKKITINGSDTAGYDKPRNHDNRNWSQERSRRTMNVEEIAPKAMVAIDGAGLFAPPTIDLSNSSLEEFKQPKFLGYRPRASKSVYVDTSNEVKQTPKTPLVEELVTEKAKQTVFPTKIEFVKQQDKTTRKPVKYAEMYRSQKPRGILVMYRLSVNTIKGKGWTVKTAHPKSTVFSAKPMSCFSKTAQSTIQRPYHSKIVLTNNKFSQKVNTIKAKTVNIARAVNTARPHVVNIARPHSVVVNAVRANQGNPKQKEYKEKGVFDSGCSRHMTGNKCYLTEYEDHDGGFVSFGDGKGRISGKVLSSDFKLHDESQVLLRVPRKDNIYSVDLKSVVPTNGLTCLVAKATLDESIHDEPESSSAAEKRDDEGISKATKVDNQERPKSCSQNINTARPSINIANLNPRTGGLNINIVSPTVITTRSNYPQSISNILSLRYNVSPKASNANSFGEETEINMSNLNASYQVPTTPTTRIHKDHSLDQVIGDIQTGVQTRGMPKLQMNKGFLVLSMIGNLMKTSILVYLPKGKRAIGTKWIFRNKKDERGIVIRNKARLVAQGYTHEKGIDYDEVFAPIEEEVYVCQPPGFEDLDYLDKVYKVVKALYGLHQAPRAWYETLAKYLLDNGFHRGNIDQTLFIKKQKGDILLVQVYVDDIIFSSTKKKLCLEFERLMHDKFQMSSIGELTFFLGLKVKQKADGIFISQDKYVTDILRKYGYQDVRTASTPMDTKKTLLPDSYGNDIDVNLYRSMIGSLMYLTSSRPDITFVVCTCTRFQVTPKVSHSNAVKKIFRYIKGKPKLGLWYPKESPFNLVAYSNNDYAEASINKKSTTGGCQFLGCRLISWQYKKQIVVATSSTEAEYVAAASCCGQNGWKCDIKHKYHESETSRNVKRGRDTKIPQSSGPLVKVGDEAVHKELGNSMERAAIIASSLEAELSVWSLVPSYHVGVADAQTWFEAASKQSNDPPLSRVNTLGSGEDSIKLMELMAHCTKLSKFVRKRIKRLKFCDKHNMVAYLEKSEGNEGFHKIIDFLSASHIYYALTECSTLYASLIEQYWQTVALSTTEDGVNGITATIDGRVKTITKASLRRHLKLEDSEGITSLPTVEIFEQLALIGYEITSDTILHCLSPKKTAWDQFSSNIATAIICLTTNRTFNSSKFIFDVMVKNLDSPHKFLMYPRASKEYSGVITPLFDTMLVQPQGEEPSTSPSRITSSPSLSPHHTPSSTPSTSQPLSTPPSIQNSLAIEEAAPMPYESPLQSVHSLRHDEASLSQNELMDLVTKLTDRIEVLEKDLQLTKKTYSTALTRLVLRVKKLEKNAKTGKARRRARIVVSEDEDAAEDSSKQGRKIADIDTDPTISLVQPQQDMEDMEYDFDGTASIPVTTVGLEFTTANIAVSTAYAAVTTASASISTVSPPKVSTAEDISGAETLVYIRRSASKAKDKGKAIMQEPEPPNKIKKMIAEQEQERINFEAALELQRQLNEREGVTAKATQAQNINWSDPAVLRYHALQNRPYSIVEVRKNMVMYLKNQGGYKLSHFKGMSYDDIRPIFEKVWDQIQSFVPMDSEKEKGSEDTSSFVYS
ncbi:putative ribonuclease H-like domain-containing protein [Tanacetum coccineum]